MKNAILLIDTDCYVLANNALENTLNRFPHHTVYILTDRIDYWPMHKCYKIEKLTSIEQYNSVFLNFITTMVPEDYVLTIQYDGFAFDEAMFSDDFFNYDYIGAPWNGNHINPVGNGGFSLRSQKLIRAIKKYLHLRKPAEAEDLFICKTLYDYLTRRDNIEFASRSVAQNFSYEFDEVKYKSFGFHGLFNLPIVYQKNLDFLFENLSNRIWSKNSNLLLYGILNLSEDLRYNSIENFNRILKKFH